jgi:hypothetical protein
MLELEKSILIYIFISLKSVSKTNGWRIIRGVRTGDTDLKIYKADLIKCKNKISLKFLNKVMH